MYENILLAIFLYYPEPIFLSQFLCGVTGLEDGQSIIVTKLTQSDLTATYSSDASTNFVPYIQDPATSMDMVQRLLYKRQVLIVYVLLTDQINLYKLKKIYLYTCKFLLLLFCRFYGNGFSFSLVPLGNVEMPGPLSISYPDTVGKVTSGNRTTLLHWNSS